MSLCNMLAGRKIHVDLILVVLLSIIKLSPSQLLLPPRPGQPLRPQPQVPPVFIPLPEFLCQTTPTLPLAATIAGCLRSFSAQTVPQLCRSFENNGSLTELRNRGESPRDLRSVDSPEHDQTEINVDQGASLQRSLGLISGSSIIVGTIIGSGIFVSPKGVLKYTGSVALSIIVWVVTGGISLMGALSYSELGTLMGKSGGEYQYLREAFGNAIAFLYAWTSVIVIRPSSLAIISLTFAGYANTVFGLCGTPLMPQKLTAAVALVTVCVVNCYSVSLAARVQVVFTAAKLGALIIIIIGGFVRLGQGHTSVLEKGFSGTIGSANKISLAYYSALWAYDGWNNLNYVVEELDKPEKNLPRANILAVLVVTVVYTFTNVSYLTVMTTDELLASTAVAVTWGDTVLASASIIIPLSVMISTFGAANGTAFSGGRVLFAAARHGNLPEVMSFIHYNKQTPLPSLMFTVFLALCMIIPGDISSLIDLFSFTSWLFYGLTFASLIIFRFRTRWRTAPRAYKVPLGIPIFMLHVSLYLLIAPLVDDPRIEFLYAAIFVLGGLVFYIPLVWLKLQVKCAERIVIVLQLFLQIMPSKSNDD